MHSSYNLHNSYFKAKANKKANKNTKSFFLYIKITNNYYKKNKERLKKKKTRKRYQNLPEEEKNKRQKRAREMHKNLFEEEKKKSVSVIVNVI